MEDSIADAKGAQYRISYAIKLQITRSHSTRSYGSEDVQLIDCRFAAIVTYDGFDLPNSLPMLQLFLSLIRQPCSLPIDHFLPISVHAML